jgi:hypothetical protein
VALLGLACRLQWRRSFKRLIEFDLLIVLAGWLVNNYIALQQVASSQLTFRLRAYLFMTGDVVSE